MKKLLILFTLLILGINSYSQVFVTLNPMQGHFNPGILGNVTIDSKVGLYGNLLYGDIKYRDDFGSFYVNQFKYGFGVSYKLEKDVTFLLGISNSKFTNLNNTTRKFNLNKYIRNSINIGFYADLPTRRKSRILFLTDFNNWESQIGLSINLKNINYGNISLFNKRH